MKTLLFSLGLISMLSVSATAKAAAYNMDEELVPNASNIDAVLEENDILNADGIVEVQNTAPENYVQDCFRETCAVFIEVDKSTQRASIRINGELLEDKSGSLKDGLLRATTGMPGHVTPNFDRHPEEPLRIFSKYSSSKYPGGNWVGPDGKGYGNMPYVVFIKGGFGVHGTTGTATSGNISLLGTKPLSHGCVRIHPFNAKEFNSAVAKHGARNTWIWVHE